jgi:alkylated DNA repair dioxygenase AlkB
VLQALQLGLFAQSSAALDASFSTLRRRWLDEGAWIDHAPGWVRGSDGLFFAVLASYRWGQRTRWMYERRVREPRLTAWWELASGEPLRVPILEEMRLRLSDHYGEVFDSAGFNLYRDGRDSVAWHGDRIEKEIAEPVVALVSLGEPRRFLLRPKGGGRAATSSSPAARPSAPGTTASRRSRAPARASASRSGTGSTAARTPASAS